MKTRFITTFALAALVTAPLAIAAEFNGNQVVCFDPVTGAAHQNPAECARFVGGQVGEEFKGPGQGAQYFTEMGLVGKNGKRLTPADIMRGPTRDQGACTTHAKDLPMP
jgi:hypothetical protein